MTTKRILAPVAVAALTLVACSTQKSTPPQPTVVTAKGATERGGIRQQEVTVVAIVESIDARNRTVTLRGPDGTTETIRVPEEVRNLSQVKRGDEVIATYFQSVAFDVVKKSEAQLGVTAQEGGARAEPGERPGAIGARVVTIVADVVKIDRESRTAVLKGAEGKTTTVNVQNPVAFDRVKVGDRVEIRLTEAIGIDVQPAPKRK